MVNSVELTIRLELSSSRLLLLISSHYSILSHSNSQQSSLNVVITLWIFCTLSVTVAKTERSFSLLNRVKNLLRSTMCQEQLISLRVVELENGLAKNVEEVINDFAEKKARKVLL